MKLVTAILAVMLLVSSTTAAAGPWLKKPAPEPVYSRPMPAPGPNPNPGPQPAPAPQKRPDVFPYFELTRSDYLRPEGVAANPLVLAPVYCTYLPFVEWQTGVCNPTGPLPTVYPSANWFSSAPNPYDTWIISVNNEFLYTPGCNTGPPNASLPLDGKPFSMYASPFGINLTIEHKTYHDNCDKIPYLAATYIRGRQGDPTPRIYTWDQAARTKLDLNLIIDLTPDPSQNVSDQLQWVELYLHFKDPATGKNYMIKKDLISPQEYDDLYVNWNWPFVNSFYYPGAEIGITAAGKASNIGTGRQHVVVDLHEAALRLFPNFDTIKPDFVGVELAVESARGPFKTSLSIVGAKFTKY